MGVVKIRLEQSGHGVTYAWDNMVKKNLDMGQYGRGEFSNGHGVI